MGSVIAIIKGLMTLQKAAGALKWFLNLKIIKMPAGLLDIKILIILALIGVVYYQNTSTIPALKESAAANMLEWKHIEIRLLERLANR